MADGAEAAFSAQVEKHCQAAEAAHNPGGISTDGGACVGATTAAPAAEPDGEQGETRHSGGASNSLSLSLSPPPIGGA